MQNQTSAAVLIRTQKYCSQSQDQHLTITNYFSVPDTLH